jgi:hypothetical protein
MMASGMFFVFKIQWGSDNVSLQGDAQRLAPTSRIQPLLFIEFRLQQ